MIDPYVSAYWGKARPHDAAQQGWHPLAYHSLDVAAAMAALLETRPAWLATMAAALCLPQEDCRQRLILAAALHDLGKYAENFQQKAPELHQALMAAIGRVSQDHPWSAGHGDIGHSLWVSRLARPRRLSGLGNWVRAAVAHHGVPTQAPPLDNAITHASIDDAGAFVDALLALLGRPTFPDPCAEELGAEIWRIAGLVILADWIGSNQDWFPYTAPTRPLTAYWPLARERATNALRHADLAEAPLSARLSLPDLLPGNTPTPLQKHAEQEEPPLSPTLYIVEDLTGAGKTEAALLLAHRLMAAGLAEGLYWALPTMATANGLYERLRDTHRHLFAAIRPSLVLAHSARDLNTAFQLSLTAPGPSPRGTGVGEQEQNGEAQCAAFIADDRKKSFLAQVGVGTLDQALLAVLPVRHQALRLAALSRRVLVVDEAHAYDPYMSQTLEKLLHFHGRLGGSAIVLSATLTGAQRQRLVNAYTAQPHHKPTSAAKQDFPLLTRVRREGDAQDFPLSSQRGTRRDLPVRRLNAPADAMQALLDAAAAGRCGVYIRNTVRDALAAVDWLRERAPAGVTVDLFHARYCLGDRLAREQAVLRRFGKLSKPEERYGQILVATQVVEQSLDLDFDHMASDLCPMDLLIQRAGRLHRHDRANRPTPELWLVGPAAVNDAAADWYAASFPYAARVYPDAGQLWLTQRTLDALGGLPLASRTPRALIEPVFGDTGEDLPPALRAVADTAAGERQAQRGMASLNTLEPDRFDRGAAPWDSDLLTPTRLGDPTRVLRLARWHDGRLSPWHSTAQAGGSDTRAWRLSEVTVRDAWLLAPLPPDAGAADAVASQQAAWPHDPPAILAMTPTDAAQPDGGEWIGRWHDRQGREQTILYSAAVGLRIP